MSIALSAIVILILIIPGVVFTRSLYSGRYSISQFNFSYTNLLILSIVPSAIIHVIGFATLEYNEFDIHLSLIHKLASGSELKHSEYQDLQQSFYTSFWYFLLTLVFAIVIGFLTRKLVLYFYLDELIGLNNKWYFLFSGRGPTAPSQPWFRFDVGKIKIGNKEVKKFWIFWKFRPVRPIRWYSYILIDVVVENAGTSFIYKGELSEFHLTKDGLDNLILVGVQRRKLEGESNYYDIAGDFFLLKYSEIKTINVTYISVEYDENISDTDLETALNELVEEDFEELDED